MRCSNFMTALLSLIFCQEMSFVLFPTTISVFHNALRNWRILWDNRAEEPENDHSLSRSPEPDYIHPSGFVRHSHEFYMLALAKLKYIETRQEQSKDIHLDEPSMDGVKNLILQMKCASAR